ncbi:MAG: hypothetical protein R3C15_05550 [Thermoleophilia bacterium]
MAGRWRWTGSSRRAPSTEARGALPSAWPVALVYATCAVAILLTVVVPDPADPAGLSALLAIPVAVLARGRAATRGAGLSARWVVALWPPVGALLWLLLNWDINRDGPLDTAFVALTAAVWLVLGLLVTAEYLERALRSTRWWLAACLPGIAGVILLGVPWTFAEAGIASRWVPTIVGGAEALVCTLVPVLAWLARSWPAPHAGPRPIGTWAERAADEADREERGPAARRDEERDGDERDPPERRGRER